MAGPDNPSIERRADHAVREAVDNIQKRFLERVGDRIARGLSLRELSEELVVEALRLTDAGYGYVLRTETSGQLVLDAVVSIEADGSILRQQDTLVNPIPDEIVDDVISVLKPTFSNRATGSPLTNIPRAHPAFINYAVCPVHEEGVLKALLVVLNARQRIDLVLVKRVQSMLDTFIRVHINSIVNRGIDHVIAGVGQTNRQLLSLLEASFNAILTVDENLTIIAFNPASEQLFGVDVPTALGTSLEVFLTHDVLDGIQRRAADYSYSLRVTDERPYRMDDVFAIRADTRRVSVELTVFHSRIDERVYTTLVLNDISGKLQSTNELHSAMEQYRTLAHLAPVGIIKLDDQWLCEYANHMWCELSCRTEQENQGDGWLESIHADLEKLTRAYRAILNALGINLQKRRLAKKCGIGWFNAFEEIKSP